MAKPIQAVELEVALAGTDTAQKPLSQALDGSGKLTLEYSAPMADRVQEVLKLGFDRKSGMAYGLRLLVERAGEGVKKEKK